MFQWIKRQGGLAAMERHNRAKAEKLYGAIDGSGFYRNPVALDARSWMNVPFTLPSDELDKPFLEGAKAAGLVALAGHRSVGGMRASIYNAMPMAGVEALVQYMREFQRQEGIGDRGWGIVGGPTRRPVRLRPLSAILHHLRLSPSSPIPYPLSMSFKILTLNNISVRGLERLPRDLYEVASEIGHPDAVLLRSADMHSMEIPASVRAIGRAGAGVNNIPVAAMTARGIPVFNAPGANANAVKELVIAGLIIGCRHLCHAWDFARTLGGSDAELHKAVEAGKKQFVGTEISGRTLGVVGLGAIGRNVANAAAALGMHVVGFDPELTVEGAAQLSSAVRRADSLDDLLASAEFVTVHVPLMDATRGLVGAAQLARMPAEGSRAEFRPRRHRGRARRRGRARCRPSGGSYVCDFPVDRTRQHAKCVTLPHLGASTEEAEENCAIMVAETLRAFLEHGDVHNAVNFPEAVLPRVGGNRVAIANENVPNMVGQISTCLAEAGLNIADLLNKSRGDLAYTLIDTEAPIQPEVLAKLRSIPGILSARTV